MTIDLKTQKMMSLCIKTVVFFSAIIGTYLSAAAGKDSFMGGSRVFMYFTIQSNLALAILSAIGAYLILKNRSGDVWGVVHLLGATSITLTGIVFCFVLAPTMGAEAWNLTNILTHVVVPIAAVIDFFVAGQSYSIQKRKALYVVIPPILYAIYAGIGYSLGWQFAEGINYPYFFLNWGSPAGAFGFSNELPFMGCMWWILVLLVFLILVGLLYLWILSCINKKRFKA